MLTIRKKIKLDNCPACNGTNLEDVSWVKYPNMYQCTDCKIITQVKADLVDIE